MPIVEIALIGEARATATLCGELARAIGRAIGAGEGSVWVTLTQKSSSEYAENGAPPQPLPVFVRVLARDGDPTARTAWALAIAGAVASTLERPTRCVHVIFEPDARGRVFFGGRADPN